MLAGLALLLAAAGPQDPPAPDAAIASLADHLDADLLFYDANELQATSVPILDEFGALDRYLPMNVALGLRSDAQTDYEADERIAGRLTRVGYRRLSDALGPAPVLAAPRLLEDPDVLRNEQDLVLGLILVTLGGFAAAFLLGGLAARALATPVQALQRAAERVGQGAAAAHLRRSPTFLTSTAASWAV